jgi:hypothetical protein
VWCLSDLYIQLLTRPFPDHRNFHFTISVQKPNGIKTRRSRAWVKRDYWRSRTSQTSKRDSAMTRLQLPPHGLGCIRMSSPGGSAAPAPQVKSQSCARSSRHWQHKTNAPPRPQSGPSLTLPHHLPPVVPVIVMDTTVAH